MKFLPWDRLQQDSSNNFGNRVVKASVRFDFLRTYRRRISWDAVNFKNAAYFHNNDEKEIASFFENLLKQSKEFSGSVSLSLYHLSLTPEPALEALEGDSTTFRYHHYKESLKTLLEDFGKFRKEVGEENFKLGYVDAPFRKVLIPIIMLDETHVQILRNDEKVLKMMVSLLTRSNSQRIYPFLYTAYSKSLPHELLRVLDWAVYIGSENSVHARDVLYSDKKESFYSIRQQVIGVASHIKSKYLIVAHPYKFEPSPFYVKEMERKRIEDENYERYLDTLNDGT